MKSVPRFSPDAAVLGANPPQLDCCDLLSEIKASERTQNIRVVMLSPSGSAERTRGLDLGADDVLSLPFGGAVARRSQRARVGDGLTGDGRCS
jgi:DNA-binding response OmpR family regulator